MVSCQYNERMFSKGSDSMKNWYIGSITKMLQEIENEHFLKQIYIIVRRHVQKEKVA